MPHELGSNTRVPSAIEGINLSNQATTLGQLAELVGGRVEGDPAVKISGAAIIADVVSGEITLVDHADRLKQLNATAASAVVISESVAKTLVEGEDAAVRWPAIV